MKRTIPLCVLLASLVSSMGQGFIDVGNTTGTRVFISNGSTTSLMPANITAPYYFALFVAPTTQTNFDLTLSGWTFTGNYATNTGVGRLLGVSSQPDGTGIGIPGYSPGSSANFALVGWSGNIGSTWADVEQWVISGSNNPAYLGVTSVSTNVVLAAYPGPYTDIFGLGTGIPGRTTLYLTTPPLSPLVIQPQSQTVWIGSNATMTCGGSFFYSDSYQWQFNGEIVAGATNNALTISNAQLANAGAYSVVVSNPEEGTTTSSNAILQVLPFDAPSIQVNGQLAVGNVPAPGSAQVSITGGFPNGVIFYTLDGTVPTTGSSLYSAPILLTNSATVQAMSLSSDFSQSAQAPAVFVQIIPVYNLQTSVLGQGAVAVSPSSGPYPSNSVVTLTASAAPNWSFEYWTNDVSGVENPLSLVMDGPLNVEAVFVQSAYPLTVSTPGGGSVTANGQTISPVTYYPTGTVVTLAATTNSGWTFLGWEGDAIGTNNPIQVITDQTNDVEAIFGTMAGTDAVGGGSVVLSQPNPIPYGTTITASAVPNPGKYLVTWSGAASGTNSPTAITVTSATPSVNALFTTLPAGKYTLSAIVNGSGSVNINPQQSYYNPGDSVSISATPNPGFNFYGWTQGASGTTNPLIVVVNSNTVIQANFVGYPSVSISPPSLVLLAGSNAVLTANAAGLPPLSYQWQNSEGLIVGATNSTYAILNAETSDAYSVIVSNPFGTVTSAVATVTVVFPPSITVPPLGQVVAAGTPVTLSVSASGTVPLGYQWWNSSGAIAGATGASLNFNPAETNDWDNYFVVVTNAYGAVTSSVAALVVYGPVNISAGPSSEVVPAGATVTLSVSASGYPAPAYQWSFNGADILGATSNSLILSRVQLTNMGTYQVLVSNAYSSQLSAPATLSMSPSIIAPYTGVTAIWGLDAVLSVGAIGTGPLSYQWYDNGVAIVGATNAMFNFSNVQFTNAGLYSVVVSSALGSVTNTALLVVNPAGLSVGMCASLTLTGVPGYTYIIQYTTNLQSTNSWVTLTNLTLEQPVELWVDTSTNALTTPHRYYQVLPGQ